MWPLLIGGGASLLGGLLGKKQNPTIDPNVLKRLFGPDALSGETQQLYQMLLNSPAFSQMMNQAGIQSTQTANRTRAALGASGLGSTPYGGFLNAAGSGYGASMQRQGKQDLFMQALRSAFEGLQNRQSIYASSKLNRQEQPTWQRMIGASLLNAGSQGLGNLGQIFGTKTPPINPWSNWGYDEMGPPR